MTEDQTEFKKPENLPAELRANILEKESDIFLNVAKFEHAGRVAKMLSQSTMVPEIFQNNPGNIMIALNFSARINADPFMLMQCMYVVHGKPGLEGKLVASLINTSGKYKNPIRYRWIGGDGQEVRKDVVINDSTKDHRGCLAYTIAQDGKELEGPTVDWKTVHAEGWYGKKLSKWQTMPELMFMYRAASWFANVHCPEVKLGMQTVEELKDTVDLVPNNNGVYSPPRDTGDVLKSMANDKPTIKPEEFEEVTATPPEPEWYDTVKWINLKSTGFTDWLLKHAEELSSVPSHWVEYKKKRYLFRDAITKKAHDLNLELPDNWFQPPSLSDDSVSQTNSGALKDNPIIPDLSDPVSDRTIIEDYYGDVYVEVCQTPQINMTSNLGQLSDSALALLLNVLRQEYPDREPN